MARPRTEVVVEPDAVALAETAAARVSWSIGEAIAARGRCMLVLAGGSTPRELYRRLARAPYRDAIDWSRVHVFWGDERSVPPEHTESNYRMARETLLDHVPVSEANVHRVPTELEPHEAAERYEAELRRVFGIAPGEIPAFDVVLLGIGADGHTASLFPGTVALRVRDRLVVANPVPQLGTVRITLTVPVLQEARVVFVLATGAEKAPAVERALRGVDDPEAVPAQILRHARGTVVWLLDRAAASRLEPSEPR